MRILMAVAFLAALLWGGYWFVGSRALDRAISDTLVATPEISADRHTIRGFPNRFDVTLDNPRIALGGVQWWAPFVQIFALTYKPHHLLAVLAHDQRFDWPSGALVVRSEDLRASLVMEAALDLPLDRVTLVGDMMRFTADGATHHVDALRAASRRIGEREHELVLLVETLVPDGDVMDRIDPGRALPRALHSVRLDAVAWLDRPLDRHLATGSRPRLVGFALTGARIAWDGVEIVAEGRLEPGPDGLLSGELALEVHGFRALMSTAREMGLMPEEHDALIAMALQGLVSREDPERLDAAFAVTDGIVRLGPITVGRLPPLF